MHRLLRNLTTVDNNKLHCTICKESAICPDSGAIPQWFLTHLFTHRPSFVLAESRTTACDRFTCIEHNTLYPSLKSLLLHEVTAHHSINHKSHCFLCDHYIPGLLFHHLEKAHTVLVDCSYCQLFLSPPDLFVHLLNNVNSAVHSQSAIDSVSYGYTTQQKTLIMSSFKKNAWVQKTASQLIPSFPASIRKKLNHALRIPMQDTPDLDLLKPFSYLLSSSDPIDVATSIDIITALDSTNHLPHHNMNYLSNQTYLLSQIYLNLKIEQLLGLREHVVADDLPQPSSTCGSQLVYPTGPFPRNSPSNSTPKNFTFISYGSKTLLRSGYSHTLHILNLSPCVPKLWGNCFRGSRQTLLRTEIHLGPLFDHIPANLDLFTDLLEILNKYPGEFV